MKIIIINKLKEQKKYNWIIYTKQKNRSWLTCQEDHVIDAVVVTIVVADVADTTTVAEADLIIVEVLTIVDSAVDMEVVDSVEVVDFLYYGYYY